MEEGRQSLLFVFWLSAEEEEEDEEGDGVEGDDDEKVEWI